MGKKGKKGDKKGKGAEKTAAKTEKNLSKKQKKMVQEAGEVNNVVFLKENFMFNMFSSRVQFLIFSIF